MLASGYPAEEGRQVMDQPGNGSGVRQPDAVGGSGAMPAEIGAPYQAGYEAGYARGREAGYRQGYAEARQARQAGSGQPEAAPGSRRRGLLGLPCEHCGTFLYSDETQCPHCKT